MLPNKDMISQPSKERHFPISFNEFLPIFRNYNFQHSEYNKRIDIIFQNARDDHEHGIYIAALFPHDAIMVCSVNNRTPLHVDKLTIISVLDKFAEIDKGFAYHWNSNKTISYRAYLSALNRIIITEKTISVKSSKYRSGDKFTNAFKPKSMSKCERIIFDSAHA